MHEVLRRAAAEAGLSLNDYCNLKLMAPAGSLLGKKELAQAVIRAAGIFKSDLIAIVAYGSWSRGEQSQESDLDLLVVIDESVSINRALYRQWDQGEHISGDIMVDPHFVHLPKIDEGISSVWAEVALEGIVIFERGFELSKYLVASRRLINRRRLVQKWVHGQRYWVEVA